MANEVQIANMALLNLGSSQIVSSLTEDSKPARVISQFWDIIRDLVLEAHPWKFATKIQDLAQLTATPELRWDYAYKLPADYLKDIRAGEPEDDVKYEIVGSELHTDEDEVTLTYIYRCENEGLWSSHFCATFAYRIAADMAKPLIGGSKSWQTRADMMEAYLISLRDAESVNDSQGNDNEEIPRDKWTEVRK